MIIAKRISLYTVLVICAAVMMFPIFYAFSISFMEGGEVLDGRLLPSSLSLDNYLEVFEKCRC